MAGGKFSQELLQKVKDSVNLIDVVGEHVVLRKSGSNYSGLCPFHSERSPSFSVSEQKQLFHCYGCKKGGDLFTFVTELHGLSFPEAIEELADRARVALPKDWGGHGEEKDPEVAKRKAEAREKLALAFKLNRFAAAFYHQGLPGHAHIEQYFVRRGVKGDLARNFYVGGAPASWDGLARHLVGKKAPLPLAVELGLIKPSPPGKGAAGCGYFDLFRNRAMFPILDLRGKVVGFGGRALPLPSGAPDVGGESPKYLNSPESLVFHKSRVAYGIFQAQKHIREEDEVILVEGYFDVLALHAAGFKNVVATCGTSLTADHLQLFRRLASKVTVLFDGDRAGISATERAMELGLDYGQVIYGAEMPAGMDPDELLFDQDSGELKPNGQEEMRAILSGARPILDTRVAEQVHLSFSGPEARTQALRQLASWLARFKDPVGREVRRQSIQTEMGISPLLFDQALREAEGKTGGGASSRGPTAAHSSQRLSVSQPRPSGPPSRPARQGASVLPRSMTPGTAKDGAPSAPWRPQKLGKAEKLLLSALLRRPVRSLIVEVAGNLPPGSRLADLFLHDGAQKWVSSFAHDPVSWDQCTENPSLFLSQVEDPQIRSIITESSLEAEPQDIEVYQESIRRALMQLLGHLWARFSQRIKAALTEAEAKKDAELQAQLMKEYLDVQRKMKEFSRFYDEA